VGGACTAGFGVNIPKGQHVEMVRRLTKAMIGAHAMTSEIILCTCYTRNEGVTWAVLDALKSEITSKDSRNNCEFLFHDLHVLDNPNAVMTWPVRSLSLASLLPLVDSSAHHTV
jgi:hypothetical protein